MMCWRVMIQPDAASYHLATLQTNDSGVVINQTQLLANSYCIYTHDDHKPSSWMQKYNPLHIQPLMVLNCYTEAFDFVSPGPEELAAVEVGNFPGSWVASYSAQMAGSREDLVYSGSN